MNFILLKNLNEAMIYHENFQASQEVILYMWSSVFLFKSSTSLPNERKCFEFNLSAEESFNLFLHHWLDTSDQKLQRKTSIESPHEEWVRVNQQWSSRSEKPSTYVLQRPWIRNEFLSVSYLTHRRRLSAHFFQQ